MKNKNIIFDELKEISPLIVQIPKTAVYTVSKHYFDTLAEEIIKKIKLTRQGFNILAPATPYSVPKNYFENLPTRIVERLHLNQEQASEVFEETEAIAPFLNTISKEQVYKVPAGFFEKIQVPDVEYKKPEAKVVSIYTRARILRISAAAAVIISFFSIGLYSISKKYDKASANDIAKNKVKNLSKEEIVHFLKSNISSQNITSASKYSLKNENAIKSSLKKISEKEIQQFLKETGESDEI